VYHGSAAVNVGAATASAQATFTTPTYHGLASVAVGHATAAANATFTVPTYHGSAAVTIGPATAAATALAFTGYAGHAAPTIGPATALAHATFVAPVFTGSAAVTIGHATGSATAIFTAHVYLGVGRATVGPATAAATATFVASTASIPRYLNHSPAEITAKMMADMGITEAFDGDNWPTLVNSEPNLPDNCITVYDTTPRVDARFMTNGAWGRHHGIQIRVRGTTSPVAWTRLNAIYEQLDRDAYTETVALDSNTYEVHAFHGSVPTFMGKDVPGGKRTFWVLNGTITIRPLT
jgi:hypothetical protein